MTHEAFEALLENRVTAMRATLASKAKEYATEDRLHNFKSSAAYLGCRPAQACLYFMTKHLVSVKDLVRDHAAGEPVQVATINEKLGDAINYLVLLEAVLKETHP